jgi:hypothetical protein
MSKPKRPLKLDFKPKASEFILAIANGPEPELCAFGARGDGKTFAALGGMAAHAMKHREAGFPLPVIWMGVTDTFASHRVKTHETLMKPEWQGAWRLADNGHIAYFEIAGQALVKLHLFGIEDQGAMDRVRMEVTGCWFEEVAPTAVLIQSNGVSLTAWLLAITSCRNASHFKPKIITTNYPDEDHWSAQRFYFNPAPGTKCFRFPPGERADAAAREQWETALADRPDLARRLLSGEFGSIMQGQQIAVGFEWDRHVSRDKLIPVPGEPILMGLDFGHTPTAIIGQENRGKVQIFAALCLENAGMRQLCDEFVLPWFAKFAPWALTSPSRYIMVGYDKSGDYGEDSNIDVSPIKMFEEAMGYPWTEPGPVRWEPRREALLTALGRHRGLLIDAENCDNLIKALNGRWYYAKSHVGDLRSDKPKKPNHPWEDYGDALCELLIRAGVVPSAEGAYEKPRVITNNQYDRRF